MKSFQKWIGQQKIYSYLLLAFLVTSFLVLNTSPAISMVKQFPHRSLLAQATHSVMQDGRQLFEQGRLLAEEGDFSEAVNRLEQAANYFESNGQGTNLTITLINLGRIQSELGLQLQACGTFSKALNISENVCLGEEELSELNRIQNGHEGDLVYAKGLRGFGDALRAVGQLKASEKVLLKSLSILSPEGNQEEIAKINLSLGNTLRAFGNLERDRQAPSNYEYQPWLHTSKCLLNESECVPPQIQEIYKDAQKKYREVYEASKDYSRINLKARLNSLSLFIELQQWAEAREFLDEWQKTDQISRSKNHSLFSKSDGEFNDNNLSASQKLEEIYVRINFAKSLSSLISKANLQDYSWEDIKFQVEQARELARNNKGKAFRFAESYADGSLGSIYEYLINQENDQINSNLCSPKEQGCLQDAKKWTQQALYLAQPNEAPSLAYQWQWQMGRILTEAEQNTQAISFYGDAVKSLKAVRNDLLIVDSEIQFSFRDQVEPVYREFISLLLTTGSSEEIDRNLPTVIKRFNDLQLAELQNFLNCDPTLLRALDGEVDKLLLKSVATIYPIVLKDRIAIIVSLPNGKPFIRTPSESISWQTAEDTLNKIREDLSESGRTGHAISSLENMYQWLIQPIEPEIKEAAIDTLIFIPDSSFRDIPMSALVKEIDADFGPNYLIYNYAVAVAPQLELFAPQERPGKLKMFLGGFGEEEQYFKEIDRRFEKVDLTELEEIKKIADMNSSKLRVSSPLKNKDFTFRNIKELVSSQQFSAIHLKTHGDFDFDPEKTFIVAFNELIRSNELIELLQTARKSLRDPLELLVFSACSTADGNNRTVFGLAGISIKVGARSAISTLWQAEDPQNETFMKYFYKELLQPNTTKAKALQRAQIELITEEGYTTPYEWANYVLVGNWL